VEAVLKHADDYKGALHEKLATGKADALLSKELATINVNSPIEVQLDDLAMQPYDRQQVVELIQKLEFKSLLKNLPDMPSTAGQLTLGTQVAADAPEKDWLGESTYTLVDSVPAAADLAKELARVKVLALDTETTSLDPLQCELVGFSIATAPGKAYYIEGKYVEQLRPILENPKIGKVGHNIKFDYKVLKCSHDITVQGIVTDTMLASYVLNPGSRGHGLDSLAFAEFGYEMMPYEAMVGKGKKELPITEVPIRKLAFYAAEDADYTWRLYEVLLPRVSKAGLDETLKLEVDLIPVLAGMEIAGVIVDVPFLQNMSKELAKDIQSLEKKIYKLAGMEFNIASPKQLKEVLFDKLKIDTQGLAKTKTGISTAASELDKMRGLHPIIDLISDYREVTKLKSTYVDALPELVNPHTKRIHTNYNQTIAATGRLSSVDPNLQNIPIRTELGRKIRHAFIAPKGKVFISLDYSQIELRIIAHLANDKTFIDGFKRGADIHTQTAAEMHNISEATVTKEMRRAAKSINFGILYGMGAYGLSRDAKISIEQARDYLKRYFSLHSAIEQYVADTKQLAYKQGYVETLFGRKRYLPDIKSGMQQVRAAAERAAINMPAQGTAADIMKKAMLAVAEAIEKKKLHSVMLLQVHDELVFEVEESKAEAEAKVLKEAMETVVKLKVPLIVDLGIGHNWQEL
jgi:DNA polymerase-1